MQLPNLLGTFLQEADDLLVEIESAALILSKGDAGDEPIHQIFRAFHTIKGSGSMFGFHEVASFTHHVETLLDQVRDGSVPVTDELSALILAAADHIKILLQAAQQGQACDSGVQAALLETVHRLSMPAAEVAAGPLVAPAARQKAVTAWSITFRPDPSLLERGGNPALLFRDLRALGDCTVEAHIDELPPLEDMQADRCYIWWTIRLSGAITEDDIQEVFLFVNDAIELRIEAAAGVPEIASSKPAGQVQPPAPAQPSASAAPAREASVRVPTSRLDRLVNLVGELVMNQSRLATAASHFQSTELAAPVEELERLISELRDDVLQIRMMPIGTIFGRFRRLVHDLSRELGKEIELVTEGEETELDKSILDQLGEPLVHLLRNSIDHGVERAEARVAAGKSPQGVIRLTAVHRGSDVVVSIEDDGAGMNRAAIRAKAVSKRLIAPEANLSDKEILNLILLPGFSTAESITSVSGRGVGMDVVKRQIDSLRGTLAISSEVGKGSSVSLTLPLTLAIIDGLLVEAGQSQYIIPMTAVTENVELSRRDRALNNGRNVIAVRGELIPYIDLRETFEMGGDPPAVSKIVLAIYEAQRVGFVVDRVIGTHQTVIQPLGQMLRKIEVVAGSTVMGDGRVALILDIPGVVRLAESKGGRPLLGDAPSVAAA